MFGEALHLIIPDFIQLTLLFTILVVASLIIFDLKSRGKILPATLVGGVILVGAGFLARAVASSSLGEAYYNFLS